MKVLVVGAGAVGGYFGGRLVEAGADITFLLRSATRERIARDGLRIASPRGDATLAVRAVTAPELAAGYDLVLLTCKAYDLDAAMDDIAPAITGDAAILPVLNGMSHLERLEARFGAERVLGGTCMIDATLGADGTILHGGTLQRIVFGERNGARTPRVTAFADICAASTLDWTLDDHIMQRMWDKLAFLSALAAMTSLFRANVGEIAAAPGGREAMERTFAMNCAIAEREGYPLSAASIASARDRLTDPAGDWSASLLRDVERGGKVESDHIVGWMLERARRHGLDDTMLGVAYTALKAYERRRDTRGVR